MEGLQTESARVPEVGAFVPTGTLPLDLDVQTFSLGEVEGVNRSSVGYV